MKSESVKMSLWKGLGVKFFLLCSLEFLVSAGTSGGIGKHTARVHKCCPGREAFNLIKGKCVPLEGSPVTEAINKGPGATGVLERYVVHKDFAWEMDTILELEWENVTFPKCPFKELETVELLSNSSEEVEKQYYLSNDNLLYEVTYDDHNNMFLKHHLRDHFCVDPFPKDNLILRICPPSCDEREPCIRKCCPLGKHLSPDLNKCVPNPSGSSEWDLPLFPHPHQPQRGHKTPPRITTVDEAFVACTNSYKISSGLTFENTASNPVKVLINESLTYFNPLENRWMLLEHVTDYCYDRFHDSEKDALCPDDVDILFVCVAKSQPDSREKNDSTAVENKPASADGKRDLWKDIENTLADVTLIVAIVCLGFTAAVLLLLIDRVNLHSWTRVSFVVSEFLLLLLFAIRFNAKEDSAFKSPGFCTAFAIIFHFAGLMTMCWLTVINFDLWWTFKVLKPTSRDKFDLRRFLYYTAFALGLPLFLISVALVIQSTKPIGPMPISSVEFSRPMMDRQNSSSKMSESPQHICRADADRIVNQTHALKSKEQIASGVIYPDYGERCSLSKRSLGAYWYGPLCFLLLANLVFFAATTCRMVNLQRMTRRASLESTHGQNQNSQIFLKIFIVSGITWNVELIGWIFSLDSIRLDMVHHLQAVALFIIFVCKKQVFRNLQMKYPIITKVIPPMGRSHRSATIASMSTEISSKSRVGFGRKLSTVSTNSIVSESYQRHESFELPPASHQPM